MAGIDINETDRDAMLVPQDWSFPVPIAYGPGWLAEMGHRCAAIGIRNPLIVTDSGSRDLPFIAGLGRALRGRPVQHRGFRYFAEPARHRYRRRQVRLS